MPWTSKRRYESLLRAAGQRLHDMGVGDSNFRVNLTGHLLLRVVPQQLNPVAILQNPFEYIHVVDVDNKMIIFVVTNGQGIMLDDDHAMFPTDELVAKLRLLLK